MVVTTTWLIDKSALLRLGQSDEAEEWATRIDPRPPDRWHCRAHRQDRASPRQRLRTDRRLHRPTSPADLDGDGVRRSPALPQGEGRWVITRRTPRPLVSSALSSGAGMCTVSSLRSATDTPSGGFMMQSRLDRHLAVRALLGGLLPLTETKRQRKSCTRNVPGARAHCLWRHSRCHHEHCVGVDDDPTDEP